MSATDFLNELRGEEHTPQETTETEIVTLDTAALESLKARAPDIEKKMDFEHLRHVVEQSDVVDKAIATEVFTMLPPMVNYSNHLTSAPSAYNRTFVMNRTAPFDAKEEIRGYLQELLSEVYAVRTKAEQLRTITAAYEEVAKQELARFKDIDPIVVFPGGKLNLLNDDVELIARTNDSLYNYPPYEGVLSNKYWNLITSKFFSEFKSWNGYHDGVSLGNVVRSLMASATYYSDLDKLIAKIESGLSYSVAAVGTKYVIEDAFNLINNVIRDTVLFDQEGGIAERSLDILKFLK